MKLSDDKITHTTHVLLKGLVEGGFITLKEEDGTVRKEIKRAIINELKLGDEVDTTVRKKLQSFSKKLIEGSPEWEVLYKKFFDEEEVRRGRR
jgi:hypothetical protein